MTKKMEGDQKQICVIDCICSWCDLLGFGAPLVESNWQLQGSRNFTQIRRLNNIYKWCSNPYSSVLGSKTLTLNDGVIFNFDVEGESNRAFVEIAYVLDDLIMEFEQLNNLDQKAGFPGVRGVLTYGHRYNYSFAEITNSGGKAISYHPMEFQLNTAFSKAYIMESSGSSFGLKGNHLFIDNDLLEFIENRLTQMEPNSSFRIEKILSGKVETFHYSIFRDQELLCGLILKT